MQMNNCIKILIPLLFFAKDSTKFAALTVKPEIAPRLKLWFPPTTAVYQVKITHFRRDGILPPPGI